MYQEGTTGFGGGLYGLIAVLVVLFLFGGNGAWGNNSNNSNNTVELLKGQQSIQNSINGNTIAQLQTANANNISQLQADYQSQISQLGSMANLSQQIAQQTSAMQLMGANIMSQQQQCCCETQKELAEMSGENRLAVCQQTNALTNAMNNGLNQIRSDLAAIGYSINKSTADIINANAMGVQSIKDLCNAHWVQDLQQKYNDAKNELSQNQQTLALTTQLNAIASAIAKIPTATASAAA